MKFVKIALDGFWNARHYIRSSDSTDTVSVAYVDAVGNFKRDRFIGYKFSPVCII